MSELDDFPLSTIRAALGTTVGLVLAPVVAVFAGWMLGGMADGLRIEEAAKAAVAFLAFPVLPLMMLNSVWGWAVAAALVAAFGVYVCVPSCRLGAVTALSLSALGCVAVLVFAIGQGRVGRVPRFLAAGGVIAGTYALARFILPAVVGLRRRATAGDGRPPGGDPSSFT